MASTIPIPALSQVQTNVAEIAKHAVAVATAAVADIEALQASNSGRDWKDSVRAATAAALAANTRTGNVLLADANGALGAIDTSVTMVVGDRILIKNEVTAANNGIYTVTTLGAAGSKFSFTRATDADTSAEVTSGLVVQVEEGTANGGHVFELTTANPITLNTTALTFGVFAPGLVQTTDARLPPTPTAAAKIIYDNGTAYVATAAGTAAQVPVVNAGATAPVFVSLSGDATMVSTGVVTVAKVNGATYPAGGALTTGTIPRVTGAAAVEYGALDLANASAVTGVLPTGNLASATAAAAGAVSLVAQMGLVRSARGVVLTNQANLAAFTVASDDGITYIETDRVLLAGQTTGTEDGLYTVGVVGGGTAALTRATDYATGSVQPAGLQVHINEGTVFNHTIWFASLAGANTVGTSAPEFYPRRYVRITTAMAGTPGIKALSAEWILDATTSSATPTVITPGTQGFLSIGALTPGDGDGSFTVTSTANETSTLQIVIEN